ncbi:hypothetical protein E2562_031735 [Oryza meyeriana var. granulata]|uniref:Uncharacterized protein n=1 Tax=Oryza meyeriana var. granulata TaxID=110450 RepID=A0A6G1CV70_9ORYZ|nr:hypothetical protein E2562_031735 [Oryza meyeriana var. granulata]
MTGSPKVHGVIRLVDDDSEIYIAGMEDRKGHRSTVVGWVQAWGESPAVAMGVAPQRWQV